MEDRNIFLFYVEVCYVLITFVEAVEIKNKIVFNIESSEESDAYQTNSGGFGSITKY